jgi:hypothetical protein
VVADVAAAGRSPPADGRDNKAHGLPAQAGASRGLGGSSLDPFPSPAVRDRGVRQPTDGVRALRPSPKTKGICKRTSDSGH